MKNSTEAKAKIKLQELRAILQNCKLESDQAITQQRKKEFLAILDKTVAELENHRCKFDMDDNRLTSWLFTLTSLFPEILDQSLAIKKFCKDLHPTDAQALLNNLPDYIQTKFYDQPLEIKSKSTYKKSTRL